MKDTIKIFRKHLAMLRPVWTLTWRDATAPSLRSGVPEVKEEDVYYNRQVAVSCIKAFGRPTLTQRILILQRHLKNTSENINYKVPTLSGYCHKVITPEKHAGGYFLSCVLYEKRHNHALKYITHK